MKTILLCLLTLQPLPAPAQGEAFSSMADLGNQLHVAIEGGGEAQTKPSALAYALTKPNVQIGSEELARLVPETLGLCRVSRTPEGLLFERGGIRALLPLDNGEARARLEREPGSTPEEAPNLLIVERARGSFDLASPERSAAHARFKYNLVTHEFYEARVAGPNAGSSSLGRQLQERMGWGPRFVALDCLR